MNNKEPIDVVLAFWEAVNAREVDKEPVRRRVTLERESLGRNGSQEGWGAGWLGQAVARVCG